MSPVLKALGAAGRGLLRYGLAALRQAGRLLRYTAADVARRPRPYALAAAGIGVVILVAVLVLIILPGEAGNGGDDEQAGAVAPASVTTTPMPTNTPTTTPRPTNTPTITPRPTSTSTSTPRPANTSTPTATPSVAAGKPTAAPGTPTSTPVGATGTAAPPFGEADTFAMVASPACVAPGGRVEATWSAVDRDYGVDLVALFPAAAQNTEYEKYQWQKVYTTGGNVVFAAPETPGPYEVRLVRNSAHLAASNPVTVQDGCPPASIPVQLEGYSASASPACVAPGGRVEGTWTAVDKADYDVIALFPAAAQDTKYREYQWQYVETVGGSAIFAAPETPGAYEVRLVRNSIHLAASNPVTVSNECPQ